MKIIGILVGTIYGVTFLTVAPEHNLIEKHKDKIKNIDSVYEYQEKTRRKSELDRMSSLDTKTGVKLEGLFAVNPITNKKVPL